MAYLNKIKILDQNGQVSGDSPFGFGIGMLREDGSGNIVYPGEGNQPITLLQKTTDGTSEYYTLVVPDGEGYTALTEYIDNRDTFLKKVEYIDGNIRFTFRLSSEDTDYIDNSDADKENVQIIDIPVKDFPIEADNIYFTEDLKLTTPFGYYQPGANGYVNTKTATDKLSVQEFFKSALQREDKDPQITGPSAKFFQPTKNISAELGSTVTFNYEVAFDEGEYPYDTTTGVEVSTASIKLGNTQININNQLKGSHTIAKLGSDSLTLSTAIKHTAGNLASSNLGNKTTKQISEKEISATGITISSYREGFYFKADKSIRTPTVNSDYLRDNSTSKTNKGYTAGAQERTVPVGTQAIILACPADEKGVIKVLNTTVNADMTNSFTKSTVSVKDAAKENSKDYTVWMYTPAEPYATEATLKITLGVKEGD